MTYTLSCWLWNTTQGIVVPGNDPYMSQDEAEQALCTYTGLPLNFARTCVDVDVFAARSAAEGRNLAVVLCGDVHVVSFALLPAGFGGKPV